MARGITVDEVAGWLKLSGDPAADVVLADVVAAVNVFAGRLPALALDDPPPDPPPDYPADAQQGLVMLAARLYRRRNSPAGIESALDAAVYVPRRDGDVDMMLRLGRYLPAGIG